MNEQMKSNCFVWIADKTQKNKHVTNKTPGVDGSERMCHGTMNAQKSVGQNPSAKKNL